MQVSTPLPGIAHHKEKLGETIIGSPLRRLQPRNSRQSLIPQTPLHYDDESERRHRRSLADIERRVSNIGAQTPVIPPEGEKEIKSHLQLCLQMFTENKICSKNVWNLKIIDYMRLVLHSKSLGKDSFQIGSTSLDISAKVYGIRVDDIYSDGIKLASSIANTVATGEQNVAGEDDAATEEGEDKENRASKRKRKAKRISLSEKNTIVKDVKTITAKIQKIKSNFFQTKCNADTSNVDRLFTNRLPMNPCSYKFMLLSTENAWISKDKIDPVWEEAINKSYDCPLQPIETMEICPPFANFEIDNWDPDSEEDHMIQSNINNLNDDVVFDDKGLPVAELDGSVHDLFAVRDNEGNDSSEEENIEGQFAIRNEAEHIVDFRPENRDTYRNEYSYASIISTMSNKYIAQVWAGPSHWKLKHVRRTLSRFSGVKEKQQMAKRTKKVKIQDTIIDIFECPLITDTTKYKVKKNPVRFDVYKVTLPEMYHQDFKYENGIALLCKPIMIYPKGMHRKEDVVDDEVEPYNYQNPNDSQYCSQHSMLGNDEDNDDNGAMNEDIHEEILERQANFCGENLIQAPETAQRMHIQYALHAKKMDMKKLKAGVWQCLISEKDKPNGMVIDNMYSKPVLPTMFSDIYSRLPSLLPEKMVEELSCPLAFIALLHLTNEHNLKLIQKEGDLRDFRIEKDKKVVKKV